jgi:GNAT superfamily N-acetyltransferase
MSSDDDYEIVQVDPAKDRRTIVDFWHASFPGWKEERFEFFYLGNPHGSAKVWMVKHRKDGSSVGSIACFPGKIQVEGKTYPIGKGADLGVSRQHRRQGLAFRLRKAMIEWLEHNQAAILIGTPNDTSAPITQRAGYTVLGREVRIARPLRSRRVLKERLRSDLAANIFSPLIDLFLRPARSRRGSQQGGVELRPLHRFDDGVSKLWSEAVGSRVILGQRTAEWLNWRVFECAYRDFRACGLYQLDSESLLGYVVYLEHDGVTTVYDIIARDFETTFDTLVEEFVVQQFVSGSQSIDFVFVGDEAIVNRMRQQGFRVRGSGRSFIVYSKPEWPLREKVMDRNNWYFTLLDNDA